MMMMMIMIMMMIHMFSVNSLELCSDFPGEDPDEPGCET